MSKKEPSLPNHSARVKARKGPAPQFNHLKDEAMEAFKSSGTIMAACTRLKIDRTIFHNWLRDDPDFKQRFIEAQDHVTEMCESAAMARGVNGVERYVISGGKPVVDPAHDCELERGAKHCSRHYLKYREYSDHMLAKLLEARCPEKYARRIQAEMKIDVKIVAEITTEIMAVIRRNTPECCPHCKNNLEITPKIAAEMEKLSKKFEVIS